MMIHHPRRHPTALGATLFGALLGATLFGAPSAFGWDLAPQASRPALEDFHRQFALAVYPYPRHGAAPLGWVGFDVYAEAAVVPDFAEGDLAEQAIQGDLPADALAVYRVGARKGLPGGFDIGVSYARLVDFDLQLASVELQYAVLEGGVVSPALSVRATGTRSIAGDEAYNLTQYGLEALVSKGFAVLTPYAGAGLVRSEGRFDRSGGSSVTEDETLLYAGVVINLLVPKISVEVQKADSDWQGAVRIALGL